LFPSVFERAGTIDFFGGIAEFVSDGELCGHAAASIAFAEATSAEAIELLLWSAPGDHETVQVFEIAGFDQQSSFDECSITSAISGPFGQLLGDGRLHAGVKDGIEARELGGISKDDSRKLGTIYALIRIENGWAEFAHCLGVSGLTWLEEAVREGIGVENVEALFAQHRGDGSFASGYAPR
jgi:hypothetical protein